MARSRSRTLQAASGRTRFLPGFNLQSVIFLSLLVLPRASRAADYDAKPPAEYDGAMFYDEEPSKPADPQEPHPEYPHIKYKAIQGKASTDAEYDFNREHIEPIRPKRQKMGRTKLQPPTTRPAEFKVKPEVLMAKYLHDPPELDTEDEPGRQRPGRWEAKKLNPHAQAEDEYDYTAVKLQGDKSPEEIFDHQKDDYSDEYDRRAFDPRVDHLKFIAPPGSKKYSRPVPTLSSTRPTPTRSTYKAPTRSTPKMPTRSSLQPMMPSRSARPELEPTSLSVLPLLKPSTEAMEYEELGNPILIPPSIVVEDDGPSKAVIPLDGRPPGPTKPPVFARMRATDDGLPTMVLPISESPDALMVAEGMRHGPEVELARYKIRNHLLSRGVDPDSDPDEIICEYVELQTGGTTISQLSILWLLVCVPMSSVQVIEAFF